MITKIQIPIYNKIQAAKGATNPYSTIKHQPTRHSELVSESNQLPLEQSNLAITKGLVALNQINSTSFKAKPISFKTRYEDVVDTKISYVYSKTLPNKRVPVLIERTDQGDVITYAVSRNSTGKFLGEIVLCKKEGNIRKIKESYPGENNALLASSLHAPGKKNLKGIGTLLMQEAVKESFKQGYDGRLYLNAWSGKSPVPFYYKMGLRFVDNEQNKQLAAYMKAPNGKNAKVPKSIEEGYMYLPEANIDHLLHYKSQKTQPPQAVSFKGLEESTNKYATIYKQTSRDIKNSIKPEAIEVTIEKNKDGTLTSYKMYSPVHDDAIAKMKTGESTLPCRHPISKKHKKYYADSRVVIWLKNEIGKNKSYKGIGTVMMQQAVLESIEKGHGGKIFLFASPIAEGKKSPVPFYYKIGLEFCRKDKQEAMEKYLQDKAKADAQGYRIPVPEIIKDGHMYLPEENIGKLLNYEVNR